MSTASSSTTIGACIAIMASILNAVGYTIQKEGHNKLKLLNKRENHRKKSILREKTWCCGFGIFVLGGLANAVALYFAPQSLVLPLSAITLVANTYLHIQIILYQSKYQIPDTNICIHRILATQILNEPFEKKSYCGIALVIIGSIFAVLFGPRTGGQHINITDLMHRWSDTEFLIFFLILSGLTVADFIGIKYYERKNILDESVQLKEIKHGQTFLMLSYGFMNAYFGSNAFLFLKAFTEFVGASFASIDNAEAALRSWYSYFILFCVVVANALYVMWQQRGLSHFPSVYIIPINQVSLIIMGTILGGVYFSEFRSFSAFNAIMFMIGILLTSFGVIVLAAGHVLTDIKIPLIGDIMASGNSVDDDDVDGNNNVSDSDYHSVDYKVPSTPSCVGAANDDYPSLN